MSGYDPGLGRVFMFDADDLAANQQGQLSHEQRRMFTNAAELSKRRSVWVLPFFLFVAAALVVVALLTSGSDAVGAVILVVVMMSFIIGLVLIGRSKARRDQAVHEEGRVYVVTGRPELDSTIDGNWLIRISGAEFFVEPLQEEALDTDVEYRVYFLGTQPRQTMLSIERA